MPRLWQGLLRNGCGIRGSQCGLSGWPCRGAAKQPQQQQRRGFAYEDTFAYRVRGPKSKAIVIHPVLQIAGRTAKPWPQILFDAEEAIGLARANRWDILPGPQEPKGGWDEEAMLEAEVREQQRRSESGAHAAPEGWHLDRGEAESDDEYDVHEEAWHCPVVRQQWVQSVVVKIRQINPKYYFGSGKTEELALYVARNPCDYIFVNATLTPTQTQNLEVVFNNSVIAADTKKRRDEERMVMTKNIPSVEVLDRNRLVLDIFALRARSSLSKLQVKMAKLAYAKTRMSIGTKASLSKILETLHEDIGPFREVHKRQTGVEIGYQNETEPFETERKLMRWCERRYKVFMAKEMRSKEVHRLNRKGVPTIGIVGYTNVGKTSLMNALTGSDLKVKDLPFQTLDTTMRKLRLPSGGHAIIADSIGFVQQLPHMLFASFKSTMEEIASCDVLLHVRDISHPMRKAQKDVVLQSLRDAGVSEDKISCSVIEVWNKVDQLPAMDYVPPEAIPVSAKNGMGIEDLLQVLDIVVGAQVGERRLMSFPETDLPLALEFLRKHGAGGAVETLSVKAVQAVEGSKKGMQQTILSVEAVLPTSTWRRWQAEVGVPAGSSELPLIPEPEMLRGA